MVGDALGAPVEGWSPVDIATVYPDGLFWFQISERGFGNYTDDTQMAIALAKSLLVKGHCSPGAAARAYAREFEERRGYGGTAVKILRDLRAGADWRTVATKYIPGGSFGNGGAMRIAPVGLAYRHAPPEVMHAAVEAALACTHVHPLAIDGAFVQALAVSWLSRQPPEVRQQPAACHALLQHLAAHARTPDMRRRLQQLDEALRRRQEARQQLAAAPAAPASGEAAAASPAAAAAVAAAGAAVGAAAGGHAGAAPPGAAARAAGAAGGAAPVSVQPPAEDAAAEAAAAAAADAGVPLDAAAVEQAIEADRAACAAYWSRHLRSQEWMQELSIASLLAEPFQIEATQAVACALSALCHHWGQPRRAVVAAVHYGGDTDTVAAMTGALAGALHGTDWMPAHWWSNLENGPHGRDDTVALALRLAGMDVRG